MPYIYTVVVDGITLDAEFDNFTDARVYVLDLYGARVEKFVPSDGVLLKENQMVGITRYSSSEIDIEIRRIFVF